MEKADYYAALGIEIPAEQTGVAGPSAAQTTGAKEQPVTGAAGEGATSSKAASAQESGGAEQGGRQIAVPTAGAGSAVQGGGGIRGSLPTSTDESAAEEDGDADGGRQSAGPLSQDERAGQEGQDPSAASGTKRTGEMSKQERAEQARLRRQRERDAAVQAAVAAERQRSDREIAQILEDAGLTNRFRDGAKIQTAQELRQWHQDAKEQRRSQRLKAGQLTNEDLQAAIEESPAMEKVKALTAQLERQQQQEEQARFQAQIDREMDEIRQMDPSVQSLQDILNGPGGTEFARLVNERGLSFLEAFKLASYDKIVGARQQAAEIGAARQAHSKDHLTAYGQNSGEGVRVPSKVRDFYKVMRPEMTDEEIRRDYARRQQRR